MPWNTVTSNINHQFGTTRLCKWGLLLLAVLSLCAAETAYLMPSLQQPVPANNTYTQLVQILAVPAVLAKYDLILMMEDYRIQPKLYTRTEPVRLVGNLTIASANFSSEGYRLLELEFLNNRILIPQGITLRLKDLGLGRARKTSGQGIPFFIGEGERSILELQNVVRVRTACAHNEPELVQALQGSALPSVTYSNITTTQHIKILPEFHFHGRRFTENVHAEDLRAVVSPADVSDTSYYAGYQLVQLNTTRVCESYVSEECVAKRGGDVCVMEQINAMLEAEQAQPPHVNSAAIVAPSVIGAVLLLAGAAAGLLLLVRRCQRRRRARRDALLPVVARKAGDSGNDARSGPSASSQGPGAPDELAGTRIGSTNPNSLPGTYSGAAGSIEALALGHQGPGNWQLVAYHRAPEFSDATPHDKLKLGVLLGAGSFGRVYKGYWRCRDVAVKVLQHDSTTASAISNEVDLVMSFRHPNIVAAYYFVTWTRAVSRYNREPDLFAQGSSSLYSWDTGANSVTPWTPTTASTIQLTQGNATGRRPLEPVAEGTLCSTDPPSIATVSQAGADLSSQPEGFATSAASSSSATAPLQVHRLSLQHTLAANSGSNAVVSSDSAGSTPAMVAVVAGSSSVPTTPRSPVDDAAGGNSSKHAASGTGNAAAADLPSSSALQAAAGPGMPDAASSRDMNSLQVAHAASATEAGPEAGRVSSQSHIWLSGGFSTSRSITSRSASSSQQLRTTFPMLFPPAARTPGGSISSSQLLSSSNLSTDSPGCVLQLIPFTPGLPKEEQLDKQQQPQQQQPQKQVEVATTQATAAGGNAASAGSGTGSVAAAHLSTGTQSEGSAPVSQGQQQQQVSQSPSAPAAEARAAGNGGNGSSESNRSSGSTSRQTRFRGPNADEAQTWLILEYCDGGTLLDLLTDEFNMEYRTGRGRMARVLTLLVDIAAGMCYLHSRNVLHGDLKPGNVLIKHESGAPYSRVAKVSDFGLSRALQAGQSHRSTRTFGTLNHTPPELLRLGRLSPAGDVYAFGIMMWEVFTGCVAFSGLHYGEVFEQVVLWQKRPDIPEDMPEDYTELVTQCWDSDPFARPNFTAVQQRLQTMLTALVQNEAEAHERFVSDL